jgi:hypothetical protein
VAFIALAFVNAAAAEPVFPPGQRIGMEPPAGLVLSKRFPGFEDPDHKAAITLLDLPGRAYMDLQKSVFDKTAGGIAIDKREMFGFASGVGILATGHGEEAGVKVHKWLLLANVSNDKVGVLAMLVNVEVPDSALSLYPDKAIRAALKTVAFRATPLAERLNMLPFKLGDLAGFRVVQALPSGVILIDGPGEDMNKQSYMILAVGTGAPDDSTARARFARDMLAGAPVHDLEVTSAETMRISSWPGNEIRAKAKGLDGAAINLVQWLRFGGGGFMRIIAVAHPNEWDKMFTRFRTVRDGIDFR